MKCFLLGIGVVLSGLAMGCSEPIKSISMSLVTEPPLPVTVSSTKIVTPEGIGSGIQIVCKDADGDRVDAVAQVAWETESTTFEAVGASVMPSGTEDIYILSSTKVGLYEVTMFTAYAYGLPGMSFSLEVTEQPPVDP